MSEKTKLHILFVLIGVFIVLLVWVFFIREKTARAPAGNTVPAMMVPDRTPAA